MRMNRFNIAGMALTLLPTTVSASDMNAVPTQLEVAGTSVIGGGVRKVKFPGVISFLNDLPI